MAKKNDSNRRRRILIDKSLQLKYTLTVVLLIVLYSFCLGFSLYNNSKATSSLLMEFIEGNPKLEAKLQTVDKSAMTKIFIVMGVNALIIIYLGIISTHKVAGPLYRFKKHLERFKDGDFSVRTNLRKDDMLVGLADDFNATSDKLIHFIENDISKSEVFLKKIKNTEAKVKSGKDRKEDIIALLGDVEKDIEKYISYKKKIIKS